MKVAIITRHAVANYGSVLQAYATQKIIEELGYDSEIINYVRKDEKGINISDTMLQRNPKWNKSIVTRIFYKILQTPIYAGTYYKFKHFRKNLLKESEKEYRDSKELKTYPRADVYCTGSDQVWGQIGTQEFDLNYFLDFAPKQVKCISVASSFGHDDISESLQYLLCDLFSKYSHITVRESNAMTQLEKLGIKSQQVLDPTLLLPKEDWESISKIKNIKTGYVLVYQLHNNKKLEKYADEFSKKTNKTLIRISVSLLYLFKSGKLAFMPSPQEFLGYIKNADYIITDSFHATVFSIIFHKRFINILPNGTSKRITNLLQLFQLENRVVDNYDDFSVIGKEIHYVEVDNILKEYREKSIGVLEQILTS